MEPVSQIDDECLTCLEGLNDPIDRCSESLRLCGHHCNHIVDHDRCHWCGAEVSDDGESLVMPKALESV